jgi:hypothetical protein
MKIVLGFALLIIVIFTAPFLFLWSLNVLFPVLAIPYTFHTLVAALIILLLLVPTKVKS